MILNICTNQNKSVYLSASFFFIFFALSGKLASVNLLFTHFQMTNLLTSGHRRYNPLLDEWIIVSPHRIQRPWGGQMESDNPKPTEVTDVSVKCAKNPLLPGSVRASGLITPNYQSVYTFHNDFPALVSVSSLSDIDRIIYSREFRNAKGR